MRGKAWPWLLHWCWPCAPPRSPSTWAACTRNGCPALGSPSCPSTESSLPIPLPSHSINFLFVLILKKLLSELLSMFLLYIPAEGHFHFPASLPPISAVSIPVD